LSKIVQKCLVFFLEQQVLADTRMFDWLQSKVTI